MNNIRVKTEKEIEIMKEGGKKLRAVKKALFEKVAVGVSAGDIEDLAASLIKKSGAKASFKMVPGYRWATCVNINDGIVHGIPHKHIVFRKGDVVSVDVGIYYKGFHTDTSFTKEVGGNAEAGFLDTGKSALKKAISKAKAGAYIYDISKEIEDVLKKGGYTPLRALVGHGVGRELHEYPPVPCFTRGVREDSPKLGEGAVLAIEVMYAKGGSDIYVDEADGWTIAMQDGKMSALFEETVAVTSGGPLVLT